MIERDEARREVSDLRERLETAERERDERIHLVSDEYVARRRAEREAVDLRERGAKLATALRAQEWGGGHFGEGCWCAGGCPDYCVQARAALSSWDGPEKAE
jgi:hypothetical protein